MKNYIKKTVFVAMLLTVIGANAQHWNYENNRQEDNRYNRRNEERNDENRRYFYRQEDRREYSQEDRREYHHDAYYHNDREYHETPRMVYRNYDYVPHRVRYYYYPYANVYFNPYNRMYYFPYRGQWVSNYNLPEGIIINENYREVYCNDNENIWAYNRTHLDCFALRIAGPRFKVGIRF